LAPSTGRHDGIIEPQPSPACLPDCRIVADPAATPKMTARDEMRASARAASTDQQQPLTALLIRAKRARTRLTRRARRRADEDGEPPPTLDAQAAGVSNSVSNYPEIADG
jgi:hypothetical protein